MSVSNVAQARAAGRTTTAADDRLIRLMAPLPLPAVLAVAAGVYALWGLAIPLFLNVDTAWLVSFNTEGTLFAGLLVFARLFPFIEARLRQHRFELTTNLRLLSGRDFEQLVFCVLS